MMIMIANDDDNDFCKQLAVNCRAQASLWQMIMMMANDDGDGK